MTLETTYWLRMIDQLDHSFDEDVLRLRQEAHELTLIFSKIARSSS